MNLKSFSTKREPFSHTNNTITSRSTIRYGGQSGQRVTQRDSYHIGLDKSIDGMNEIGMGLEFAWRTGFDNLCIQFSLWKRVFNDHVANRAIWNRVRVFAIFSSRWENEIFIWWSVFMEIRLNSVKTSTRLSDFEFSHFHQFICDYRWPIDSRNCIWKISYQTENAKNGFNCFPLYAWWLESFN